jgi:hypothetical protein
MQNDETAGPKRAFMARNFFMARQFLFNHYDHKWAPQTGFYCLSRQRKVLNASQGLGLYVYRRKTSFYRGKASRERCFSSRAVKSR